MYIKTFNKPYKKNLINIYVHKRFMMSGIFKTSNRMINQNLQNITNTRTYAASAGKFKFSKEQTNDFSKQIKKDLINNHSQFITDFNIIYENPDNINLYAIASLHTKSTITSHKISSSQNYNFENKPQEIQFHEKSAVVTGNLHLVKNSKKYFDNTEIKKNIENTQEYKKLFDNVIQELQAKGIKYRVAENDQDNSLTGFNVLLKRNILSNTNELLETLKINKQHDEH